MAVGKTNSGSTATTPLEIMERFGIADALKTLVDAAILENNKASHPVGKIIFSTDGANPAECLGFGTWEAWGSGRVPVGVDASEAEFEAVEKSGGEKTHTLIKEEMPPHTHAFTGAQSIHDHTFTGTAASHGHTFSSGKAASNGAHVHALAGSGAAAAAVANHSHTATIELESSCVANGTKWSRVSSSGTATSGIVATGGAGTHGHSLTGSSASNGAHEHTVTGTVASQSVTPAGTVNSRYLTPAGTNSSEGSGAAHNNLQPYITCYMWKRTA